SGLPARPRQRTKRPPALSRRRVADSCASMHACTVSLVPRRFVLWRRDDYVRVCQSDPQRTDLSRQRSAQKRTYLAPGHKETLHGRSGQVRFTPQSEYARSGCEQSQQGSPLIDQLVAACGEAGRHFEPEYFGSLEVDNKLELGGLIDRQIGGLLALENPGDIEPSAAIAIRDITAVAHQPTLFDIFSD